MHYLNDTCVYLLRGHTCQLSKVMGAEPVLRSRKSFTPKHSAHIPKNLFFQKTDTTNLAFLIFTSSFTDSLLIYLRRIVSNGCRGNERNLQRTWQEAVMSESETLPQHFRRGTEKNHDALSVRISDLRNKLSTRGLHDMKQEVFTTRPLFFLFLVKYSNPPFQPP